MNILSDCLKISAVLKAKKLVNVFLRLSSKTSINRIIENKKYKPPNHCVVERHNNKLSSKCLRLLNIVNPVEVKPDIASK